MDDQDKRKSVRRLFIERMKREGREPEWYDTVRQVQRETGLRFGQACGEAMRRMGYQGPRRERELHEEFLRDGQRTRLQQQLDAERQAAEDKQRRAEFMAAFVTLPDHATDLVELKWIQAHPAMARKARGDGSRRNLELTAADILDAPHGPAPSKSAACALQAWVHRPEHFFKTILGQTRRSGSRRPMEAEAAERDEPMLGEIDRMLQALSGRRRREAAGR